MLNLFATNRNQPHVTINYVKMEGSVVLLVIAMSVRFVAIYRQYLLFSVLTDILARLVKIHRVIQIPVKIMVHVRSRMICTNAR